MNEAGCRVAALGERHLDELQAIEQRAYSHPWSQAIMRDTFRAGTPCTGLLDEAGHIAAYAFVLTAVGEAQVLNITVQPERQGQGLGRRLMQHILDSARQQGCTQVLLEVRRSNKPARLLYESLGFATLGVRKGYYPQHEGREDALVLGYEIL